MRRAGVIGLNPPPRAARAHAGGAASQPLGPAALLEALELHRDHHFRRTRTRRVTGEKSALEFIDDTGFAAAFTAGMGVPCLREAIVGRRDPDLPEHLQHDHAILLTWAIKDSLPARKCVYYGKVIAGRPGFVALAMLPAFLRLRAAPGGYRALYQWGLLSHCAKLVMDALVKRGPAETRALKLTSGYAEPRRRAEFDRAMKELQEKFLALKVEERYEPFTYVWDTVEHRWGEVMREARGLAPREAAYQIVRRYFEIAAYGSDRAIARVAGITPQLVENAARRLERERVIRRGQRVDGLRETVSLLALYARKR